MSESFGARARKFMGWYSPEEPIDEFDEFDEVEEVAPVADITPVSRPTLTSIRRDEPAEDLTRIVTIHPTAYSDAVTIGEAFRDGTPVIINLTDMGEEEARRLVDFAAGLTFGLHGVIERVTNRVFLLSPATVEVAGDNTSGRRGSSTTRAEVARGHSWLDRVGTERSHQPLHDGAVSARHSGLGSVFRARMAPEWHSAGPRECSLRAD